jgi:DNA helicase II / ATP-dependent DNA helicase PcrA
MAIIPSNRQVAVHNAWDNTDSNLLIEAVAGSGKTTLLLQLLRKCRYRVLFVAFNKSIKTEIQSYIERNDLKQGKAMTMHGLGLLAIRKSYSKFKLNNSKNYEIVNLVRNSCKDIFDQIRFSDRMKITYMLMDMNDVSRIYMTVNIHEIKERMIAMDRPFYNSPFLRTLWIKTLQIRDMYYNKNVIEIDFLDMIYIPVKAGLTIPIAPTYLMIDEAQDLNTVQHKLIDNLISQGDVERFIAVGDRNQSIYGFSGAHESSFDLFKEKDNVTELPLDICYRLPVKVLGEANEVYDVMTGFKTDEGTVGIIEDPYLIKDESMVVCRNSSPLFSLYFQLMAFEKRVYIKGSDVLGRLKSFIRPFKRNRIDYIIRESYLRVEEIKTKEDATDHEKFEAFRLEENINVLKHMLTFAFISNGDKGEDLLNKVDSLFQEEEGGIILCTIHKSKGLEADVVYILNEHLIPSKHANSAQQQKQEMNLKYVARTRARKELYYLNL